jgi:acyl carrier protein
MGLDTVELLMEIERAFGIAIPDQQAEQIITVGDYYEVVWEHLQRDPEKNRLSRQEVETTINQIIVAFGGVEPHEVVPGASITNDLGLD